MAKFNANDIAVLEPLIGRKMTAQEIESGKLNRHLTPEQQRDATLKKIEAANFKPVMAADPNNPSVLYQKLQSHKPGSPEWQKARDEYNAARTKQSLDIAQAEAEAELLEKARASMTPQQVRLEMIKRDRAKFEADQAAAKAKDAHLAAVAPTVARLEKLRDELDADPAATEADLFAINRAILQLQTVGGDKTVAAKYVEEADAAVAALRKTKGELVSSRITSLEADLAALRDEQQRLTGKPAKVEDEAARLAEWDAKPSTAAWREFEKVDADPNATTEQKDAARKSWLSLVEREAVQQ